jgi:hypothetical protein
LRGEGVHKHFYIVRLPRPILRKHCAQPKETAAVRPKSGDPTVKFLPDTPTNLTIVIFIDN